MKAKLYESCPLIKGNSVLGTGTSVADPDMQPEHRLPLRRPRLNEPSATGPFKRITWEIVQKCFSR